jgi:hypothetical protein
MGVLAPQPGYAPATRMRRALALAVLSALVPFSAASASAAPRTKDGQEAPAADETEASQTERTGFWAVDGTDPAGVTQRRFMIGLEGVVMQAPPLRTDVVFLDPRFIGRGVAMGGLGLLVRARIRPLIGFDATVRSGSIRYRDRESDDSLSHDLIATDLGVLLYLGRGQVAQFAASAGMGGSYNRLRYELEQAPDGRQQWGSGFVRVGAEAEFLIKRVAFVMSLRTYGVFTVRDQVSNSGALFEGSERRRAPVAALQTHLVGSAGIAFRF